MGDRTCPERRVVGRAGTFHSVAGARAPCGMYPRGPGRLSAVAGGAVGRPEDRGRRDRAGHHGERCGRRGRTVPLLAGRDLRGPCLRRIGTGRASRAGSASGCGSRGVPDLGLGQCRGGAASAYSRRRKSYRGSGRLPDRGRRRLPRRAGRPVFRQRATGSGGWRDARRGGRRPQECADAYYGPGVGRRFAGGALLPDRATARRRLRL